MLGLPAQIIVMEITQGLLLEANDGIADQLLEFRNAGMQISIEDFGADISSSAFLNHLKSTTSKLTRLW